MSEEQRRGPRNLQGLLQFAMNATRAEDAPNPSAYQEMDPERRRFLEEAIRSLTVDVVEQLQTAMDVLIAGNATEEEQVQAMETVTDFIVNIDTANDFYKIGGFCILMPCLNSQYADVRQATAELIGELAQNNPFCQKHLLDLNVLPKLVELLNDQQLVANAALHAISCMIRNHFEPALKAFLDIGGLECLIGILETGHNKLVIKSSFLLSNLCNEDPKVRDEIVRLGAIERLTKHLVPKVEYDTLLETTLSALSNLIQSSEGVSKCQEPHLNLFSKLQEIKKVSGSKDEFQDCLSYIEDIMERCFSHSTVSHDDTDR